MQINSGVTTILTNTSLPSRDSNRLDEQPAERARRQNQERQPAQGQNSTVEISDAARQAASQQQVAPPTRSESNQNTYQYYPSDRNDNLTTSQQRALQAYGSNQQLGREAEASGEFLGGVDIFV